MAKPIRQGDVMFVPVKRGDIKGAKWSAWQTELTVALGEATGHHHTMYQPDNAAMVAESLGDAPSPSRARKVEINGRTFIEVEGDFWLKHQEHEMHLLREGLYEIVIEQEYDPLAEEMKQVID